MITQLEDFLTFVENNARYDDTLKQWQIPDPKNNGQWKKVARNIVVMEYLVYKVKGEK